MILDDTEAMNDRERAALVERLELELMRPVSCYRWPLALIVTPTPAEELRGYGAS